MMQLRQVEKVYRENGAAVYALRSVNLAIQEGEYVAIVGRSGSGKSTLLNILGCLDTPSAGTYQLCGKDLTHASPRDRAKARNREIGFIFQGYNLAPRLTALENVELPLLFRGISRRQRLALAEEALAAVGLSDRSTHYPSQLSGGQQQRVAIARAMAARPPIILADEPTGSLDPEAAKDCLLELQKLHQAGHTVVLITHDMTAAASAARRITIQDGRIATDC